MSYDNIRLHSDPTFTSLQSAKRGFLLELITAINTSKGHFVEYFIALTCDVNMPEI